MDILTEDIKNTQDAASTSFNNMEEGTSDQNTIHEKSDQEKIVSEVTDKVLHME